MKGDNIILTGFMGCGKTSIGNRLSRFYQRAMTDTDRWIEEKQQMSVSDIFQKFGEQKFRQMETDCLKELLNTCTNGIISVGGGLPVREENRSLLKQLGRVYYLKISPHTVYERLKEDTTRPLLQGENPHGKIEKLIEERKSFYEAGADEIIEADQKSFDEIIAEIDYYERKRKNETACY